MFGLPFDYDTEPKTKHGLEKLELMVRFISVLEGEQHKEEYAKFKLWLRYNLKRHLTDEEDLNLAKGIVNYLQSDEATNERMDAMKYIFNAEFLSEPACV